MVRIFGLLLVLLSMAPSLVGDAWGQDKRASRELQALRRSQQQVQELRQQNSGLQGKLAALEREKAELAQDQEELAGQVAGAVARARSESAKGRQLEKALEDMAQEKQRALQEKQGLEREKQALQTQKADLDKRLAELAARQTGTEAELARFLAEKKVVEAALQARVQQVASCEDKNLRLYVVGRDLIEQCRDQSRTDAVLRLEPFTGIKRVAIENLLEEYRDKLDAQRLPPRTP